MYFASLKARDTNTKIKVLGTDTHETTDPLEITNRLLDHYTNVFCAKPLQTSIFDHPELNCIKNIISNQQKEFLNSEYSPPEIYRAVTKLNETSSPGIDGMTGRITKVLANLNINKFTHIVNDYVRRGSERAARFWLKILQKPGKTDYSTLQSYRPI